MIIVPGESEGLTQVINDNGDEYDDHCIRGLTGRNAIAYILVARETGDYLDYEDAEAIAVKFLEISGGLFSTQTYTYDFSPQNPGFVGDGSLDTAIVFDDGVRRSIQRTGYFEIVNSSGGRKIVSVDDGEIITDEVQVPTVPANPTGHPTINPSTGSTV